MTDRPILFSAPMVKALLAGRKMQTRRALSRSWPVLGSSWKGKSHPWEGLDFDRATIRNWEGDPHLGVPFCHPGDGNVREIDVAELGIYRVRPPIDEGDVLWVREAGYLIKHANWHDPVTREDKWEPVGWRYSADDVITGLNGEHPGAYIDDCSETKRPSIHMPRWASRLTLVVEEVKVERLNDISEDDATAEGITTLPSGRYYCGEDEEGEITSKSPITAYAWLWNRINGEDAWARNDWVAAYSFRVHRANIDSLAEAA